jgi:hypothetical protein
MVSVTEKQAILSNEKVIFIPYPETGVLKSAELISRSNAENNGDFQAFWQLLS